MDEISVKEEGNLSKEATRALNSQDMQITEFMTSSEKKCWKIYNTDYDFIPKINQ